MTLRANRRNILTGRVTSDKMNKTRVVQVIRSAKHSKYNKTVHRSAKVKAHDEQNVSRTGDTVRIMETRPLSKDKRWCILDIVQKSQEVDI